MFVFFLYFFSKQWLYFFSWSFFLTFFYFFSFSLFFCYFSLFSYIFTLIAFSNIHIGSSKTVLNFYSDSHLITRHTSIFFSLVWVLFFFWQDWKKLTLLLSNNYIIKNLVSLWKTTKKWLQNKVDKANKKKLQCQPIAIIRVKKSIQLMFSSCRYIPKIKLKNKW